MGKQLIDCINEDCPIPLIKTRKAIMDAKKGDEITVVGTHRNSFSEILSVLNSLGIEVLEKDNSSEQWKIRFKI